jgi:transposase
MELAKEFGDRKVILVVDGAGWHKSKGLMVPNNIELAYLPPYSPELNPIEKLWLYIKRATIRNKIYDTIDDLENAICDFINSLSQTIVWSVCKLNYLFIYIV